MLWYGAVELEGEGMGAAAVRRNLAVWVLQGGDASKVGGWVRIDGGKAAMFRRLCIMDGD
jgi:hypothetical protein